MDLCEPEFLNIDVENLQPMQKKLLERYGRNIYAYVLEKTGSRKIAGDITARVFIDLYDMIKASNTTDSLEILIKSMADYKINGITYADEDFAGIEKMVDAATCEENTEDTSESVFNEKLAVTASMEKRSDKKNGHVKEKTSKGLAPGWIVLIAVGAAIGSFIFASYVYSTGFESFFSSIKESFDKLPMAILFR